MSVVDLRRLYPVIPHVTNDIIEHIKTHVTFYAGSSLRMCDQCYLTNKMYPNGDELISVRLHGTRHRFPYNAITIHPSASWMFRCMELYHTIENNCIPYNNKTVQLDIPKKIKIMRSSGKLCDATFNSDFGMRLGRGDNKNEISFNVHFYQDGRDIEDPVKEHNYLELYKDMNLDKIQMYNDEFKEVTIRFNNFSEQELEDALKEDSSGVKKEVMEYFNGLLKEWIDTKVKSVIEANSNNIDINIVLN